MQPGCTERAPEWRYLEWTPERVAAFWNFTANWPPHHEDYFARQVGKGVVRFARSVMPFADEVVDFGCGIGDLLECLLSEGVRCSGIDASEVSVKAANERFLGRVGWKGAPLWPRAGRSLPDSSVGTLFFVETIEHLPPETLPEVLRELHRLLAPDSGRLLVTTPNDELLARQQVFCPGCHCVFHRYQHVASYSRSKLLKTMESAGFETVACDSTDFGRYLSEPTAPRRGSWLDIVLDLSLRDFGRRLKRLVARSTEDRGVGAPGTSAPPGAPEPHLYWVGFARQASHDRGR
jgi:2-polyprenyl-3-methyl-5-hydroxy-6-metoxy-1,4-benzoquinol methylase